MFVKGRYCGLIAAAVAVSACLWPGEPEQSVSANRLTAVYRSATGETMTAQFDTGTDTAEIRLPNGRRVILPRARSGSGARYSDGKETFWEHQGEGSYWTGEALIFQGRVQE
jgi:membrane-bound inhibitor of C-type lysozyme